MRKLHLLWLIVLTAWATSAAASVHQAQYRAHPPTLRAPASSSPASFAPAANSDRYVAGYFPHWADDFADIPFDLLDEVIYFGASVEPDGSLGELNGWPPTELIAAAHDEGCRVTLCLIDFSPSEQSDLLNSASRRAALIDNLVEAVVDAGADGVNFDFEALPVEVKGQFVALVQDAAEALAEEIDAPAISVATPAIDWAGAYDFDQLAAAGRLFVMTYDYHWSSGDPGPVAPLYGSDRWGDYAYDWTIDDYRTYLAPYGVDRVVLGLPLYGYDWPSLDASVPGEATGTADAWTMAGAWEFAAQQGGGDWDDASSTPYLIYQDGAQTRQLWYEDLDSLALKIEFAIDEEVGGIGFWALTYEQGNEDFWQLIANYRAGGDVGDDDFTDADDDDDGCGC
ncbi:MAG TPA: glycosyl hydrolase family 18 protein [bacterium]|nr:glycosyl hydrolase family 18 protein [bacterium]